MTKSIREMLVESGGSPREGASEASILAAERALGVRLPGDYREFLRWSNGWDDAFGETWLVLDDVESMLERNDEAFRRDFPGLVAIGGNGGLETYALDYGQGDQPTRFVALDANSASPEDIWAIDRSLTAALARLLAEPSVGSDPPAPGSDRTSR